MRFVIFIQILIFCFLQPGMAQQDSPGTDPDQLEVMTEGNDPDQMDIVVDENQPAEDWNDVNPKRLQTHLEVGTSFMFSPNNYYGPSFYVAPSLSYLVTPRLTLTGGIAVERTNLYMIGSEGINNDGMLPMTRAYLFARGTYMLTSRLALTGSVYKVINDVPRKENVTYPYPYNYNYQGMTLGLDYKINDSFTIGFQVRTQGGTYNTNSLIPPAGYVYVPGF